MVCFTASGLFVCNSHGTAFALVRKGTADIRDATIKRINGILTRRQRELVGKMYGEPFDFTKIRQQPPGP
jgi:hypothetical protein